VHPLLRRQLRRHFGGNDIADRQVTRFVAAVDDAYAQADTDRAMLERSMELSSRELLERNEKLATAEREYRAIFENSTDGIYQATPGGRFIAANPALAAMCGYDSPEQLKTEVTDLSTHLHVRPADRAELRARLPRDGSALRVEVQVKRRDGTPFWVSAVVRAILDDRGEVRHYEGTVSDITSRRRAEAEREELQGRLLLMSRQAGMAEVATGVLHNVGNVLNSINVSATLVSERVRQSKLDGLVRAMAMLKAHADDLAGFLVHDDRGRQVPQYLLRLSEHLAVEQQEILGELESLVQNLEHIKRIVTMQQSYARVAGVNEAVTVPDLIEDSIKLVADSLERHHVRVVRQFAELPQVNVDKHHLLQVLLNLLSNAKQAMRGTTGARVLTIRTGPAMDADRWFIEVTDTGCGIAPENLTRIFSHGFSTKEDGHGFGLHSSALAARAMGGSLTARSNGSETGATFTLDLPLVTPPVLAADGSQDGRAA
jgi:PAS domain S-box-containing protein